ncbi:DNA-binding response regulator [Sporomusaceae bacterium FL31]|nr:DNA-binding response regulator [Sporomusaceae bacterium FL31]GCE34055.1 DNA-binding response regulator [Sporomusaceae bacterium]
MMELKCWEFMHRSDQGVCIVNPDLEIVYMNEQACKLFAVGDQMLYRQFESIFDKMFQMITTVNTALCNHSGMLIHSAHMIRYNCFSFHQGMKMYLFIAFDDHAVNESTYHLVELTPREKEILQAIAQGKTNKQISTMLCIGIETVKSHIRNLFTKTGVKSRAELIAKIQLDYGTSSFFED